MITKSKTLMITALCLLFLANSQVRAQAKVGTTALTYLSIVNSPRANGMGGCTINLVDEHSPLYNPGALGLFHLEKRVAISTPINETKLVSDNVRMSTYGLSLGGSLDQLRYDSERSYNAGLGLAVYRLTRTTDIETISGLNIFHNEEKSTQVSIGLGLNIRGFCQLGLGLTLKSCKSDHMARDRSYYDGEYVGFAEAKATAFDFGLIAEMPLHELFSKTSKDGETDAMFFELTPSLAFVRVNMSKAVTFEDSDKSYPLPTTNHYGVGVTGALRYRTARVVSLGLVFEGADDRNLEIWTYKRGGELGLADILFVRYGEFSDDPDVGRHVTTYGGGLCLNGVIRWLESIGNLKLGNNTFGRMIRNANLSMNYGRYKSSNGILDKTEFFRIDLST